MNLLDSHDTERLLWTLTPGAETTAGRETQRRQRGRGQGAPAARLAHPVHRPRRADRLLRRRGRGHRRRRSRRPPHVPVGGPRRSRRTRRSAPITPRWPTLRHDVPALVSGDFRALLADDADGVAAYGRKTTSQAAITVLNRSTTAHDVTIPVAGYLPDGVALTARLSLGSGGSAGATVGGGELVVTVPARGALVARDRDGGSRWPGRPHEPPRYRRGGPHGGRRLGRGRGRRLVRRLDEPGRRWRLHEGDHQPDHGDDLHARGPAQRVAGVRRGHGQRRGRERERVLERGRRASRSTSSAGRTSSGRPR